MNFILNPKNFSEKYINYLNECFNNWGNKANFDWAITRVFDHQKPDFFVLESIEKTVLAGSAITYRKLKFTDDSISEIGIMTGSWTLPASRGLGCFTKIIQKSLQLVQSHKKSFLTAFVTENNASFRRLQSAGSKLIATNYIISENLKNNQISKNFDVKILENTSENVLLYFQKRQTLLTNKIHFDYNISDFESQFIKRVNPVFLLRVDNELAIVEQNKTIFQLHFSSSYSISYINKIVDWANNQDKEIIFFTTDKNHEFANIENFKTVNGFFTILPVQSSEESKLETILEQNIHIEFGDKM